MLDKDLVDFFDNNLEEIFLSNTGTLMEFMNEFITDKRVKDALRQWPDDVKLKVVERFKAIDESGRLNESLGCSWSEFYEMYDGKFDEKHMLHITIKGMFRNHIEDLGYTFQQEQESWHKPQAGEFKYDDDGNLVIIHSCPDREIFPIDAEQYIDELGINTEWTIDTTLSIM